MSPNQTKSDWSSVVDEKAKKLSRALEVRFNDRLAETVNKVLGAEELGEQEVIERTGVILNSFFDTMVGTTVGLISKHANPSEEMEQRVLANVSRWFVAIRAMGEKNGNT